MHTPIFRRLVNYDQADSFASRMRAKRSKRIISIVEEIHKERGICRILDLGGTPNYWNIFPSDWLRSNAVKVTLLNVKAFQLREDQNFLFDSVSGDARNLAQYPDSEFDLVHSNSVIEHVGLWRDMKLMACEIARVGRAYYVQTPNFWFPIEPHYFFPALHWLPLPLRVKLAMRMPLGSWPRAASVDAAMTAQQAAILLDFDAMKALFPDATLQRERFFGLTKSLVAMRLTNIQTETSNAVTPTPLTHAA